MEGGFSGFQGVKPRWGARARGGPPSLLGLCMLAANSAHEAFRFCLLFTRGRRSESCLHTGLHARPADRGLGVHIAPKLCA